MLGTVVHTIHIHRTVTVSHTSICKKDTKGHENLSILL